MAGHSSERDESKLNVELNLVPFIDLLSSLVLFLLVTAVWLQVGTIPASVESTGKARFASNEETRLTVRLTPQGFQLSWPSAISAKLKLPKTVAKVGNAFDLSKLEEALLLFPKSKTMPLAAVTSEDSVEYGLVVETIDTLKKSGFTSVALSTN